jgi:hypothetical protein
MQMRFRPAALVALVWFVLVALPPTAGAQSNFAPVAPTSPQQTSGWTVTPGLGYAFAWDNNVLIENADDQEGIIGEALQFVRPRAAIDFRGRRGQFGIDYSGTFVLHQDLKSLNSFDQRLGVGARRTLSRRLTYLARYDAADSPTTELTELVGVPFMRVGSRLHDVRTGFDYIPGRKTQASVSYRFHRVEFDPASRKALTGGHSHGGSVAFDHALTNRTSITGDYEFQRATQMNRGRFALQNGWGGLEHQVSDHLRVFGAMGVSHLVAGTDLPSRLGPAWRAGLSRDFQEAVVSVVYTRSLVPAYGFGGTTQNEDLSTRLRLPLARRVFARTAFAWRRNEPLQGQLKLTSLWFEGVIGYAVNRWMQLEGFSTGSRQTINQPGGTVNHYQFGFQITAAKSTRVH